MSKQLLLSVQKVNYYIKVFTSLDLNKKEILILHDISFNLKKGELICLLGPNGCGKTTLCKIIAGLKQPTKGKLFFSGSSYKKINKDIHKNISMVFQNVDVSFIGDTLLEDIKLYLFNLGITNIKKRINFMNSLLNIEPLLRKPISTLSGGQKQLALIGELICVQPKLAILDEPTSMLDSDKKEQVILALKKLKEKFKTAILLVTHHINEASKADRIMLMLKGKITKFDVPNKILFNKPLLKSHNLWIPDFNKTIIKLSKIGLINNKKIIEYKELKSQLIKK